MLAYNLYNGRALGGRIFPAMFFAPHGYIDREQSLRNFCIAICHSFSYCRVLIPLRDPLGMSGSMIGCVHMRAMPAPSAQWVDFYTYGFYQHFRSKDDPIYKLGILVRFEDLKLNLKATIASMIEILNIPYSESLMTTTINGEICGNTHSHIQHFSDGMDASPVYWHIKSGEFLNEYDKYRIEMLVSEYYSHFGYEPKFYDGKKYTWPQAERMMSEPMKCDTLDVEKGLCGEREINEHQKRAVSLWKKRFDEPVPKDKALIPLRVLKPKEDLLQMDLYK